jgi:hypothetical protein
MAMVVEERPPLFENEDWAVVESGLEHKRTGYFIEREALAHRRADGLWLWPMHVAEKSWCRLTPFMEAFSCAAEAYGHGPDVDLARSFEEARQEVADWPKRSVPQPEPAGLEPMRDEAEAAPASRLVARPRGPARTAARSATPWRPARRIRRAGSTLVRLLQAAWNKK